MTGCPSDWALDCFIVQGRPSTDPIADHLQRCGACEKRLAERDACADELAKLLSTRGGLPRALARTRLGRFWLWPAVASAVAVVLVMVIGGLRPKPYHGMKGGSPDALSVSTFCRRADRVSVIRPGEAVEPGDALRFAVRPRDPRQRFVLVVGMDGDEHFSTYYPATETEQSVALPADGALPGSVVLDAGRGPERFLVLASEHPLDVSAVRSLVVAGRQLDSVPATRGSSAIWLIFPKRTVAQAPR